MIQITDATFQEEVLDCELPVMVVFTADHCGPCKLIKQMINDVNLDDGIKVVEMEVSNAVETAPQYAVRAVPNTVFLLNGKIIGKPRIGAMQEGQLLALIDETTDRIQKLAEIEKEIEEELDSEDKEE